MALLGNAVVYVILYVVFMVPTYILPYVGSNSSAINAMGVAANAGMNPAFWIHLISLLILVVLTWFRGVVIDKKWLIVFPILASAFDILPGLSLVPLVPTVLHILAIVLGVMGARPAVASVQ